MNAKRKRCDLKSFFIMNDQPRQNAKYFYINNYKQGMMKETY